MRKIALIYLGVIVVMMAFITGLPGTLWSLYNKNAAQPELAVAQEAPTTEPATPAAPVSEVVAKSAINPGPVAAAQIEPVESAASSLAAAQPAAESNAASNVVLEKPMVRGGSAGLDQTTSAILAELMILPKAEVSSDEQQMKAMSVAALSGLRAVRGQQSDTAATLESLVAQALREGQTDSAIDAIVNQAAGRGEISVPSALVTSDGKVDTAVLLANLVTKAQIAAGSQQQVNPNDVIAGGEGVEVRMVSKANGDLDQHQFYTVLPGDSLGAISAKFYGDAAYFPAIFDANRALLSTPDKLRVGQRLVIPAPETL